MSSLIKNFINGKSTSTNIAALLPIYNPATGKKINEVALATDQEVQAALDAASSAFPAWSNTSPLKRVRVLFKFKALLENHIDELAKMISLEHGKVIDDAKGEVMRAIELVEHCCGMPSLLRGSFSENVATGMDCHTFRQALGVCVGVTPFNFPVMVSTWMFIPAIACGNTFILKPSEKDPSSPLFLAQLLQEAGLPDGVFNVVNGVKHHVDMLITADCVKAVACVGSTPVAKYIYETAILHGKRAQTFGGAKNHCVIMPDADLDDAAEALIAAAFGAAGERCMAISVAVPITDKVADELTEKIKQKMPNLKIAPGCDPCSQMGPLISDEHRTRVKSYIDLGVQEGAKLVVDGREAPLKEGFFLGANLFDHVTPKMRVYQEEIFGPVLCIVRQPDLQSAIDLINAHPYANGTAIFTCDGAAAREFASKIQVGMVGINVPIPVPIAYHSFGGWKQSIFGDVAMHGEEGVRFYTKTKSVTTRWPQNEKLAAVYHMPVN